MRGQGQGPITGPLRSAASRTSGLVPAPGFQPRALRPGQDPAPQGAVLPSAPRPPPTQPPGCQALCEHMEKGSPEPGVRHCTSTAGGRGTCPGATTGVLDTSFRLPGHHLPTGRGFSRSALGACGSLQRERVCVRVCVCESKPRLHPLEAGACHPVFPQSLRHAPRVQGKSPLARDRGPAAAQAVCTQRDTAHSQLLPRACVPLGHQPAPSPHSAPASCLWRGGMLRACSTPATTAGGGTRRLPVPLRWAADKGVPLSPTWQPRKSP